MTKPDFLTFVQARRAALIAGINADLEEVEVCDAAIKALTPTPNPEPEPEPGPGPGPAPVPGGPAIQTLAELMTALGNAKPGGVLPLAGNFPPISLSGVKFSGVPVTLKGAGAVIERMVLAGCSGLRLDGLKFMPAGPVVTTSKAKPYLLTGDAATNAIEVNDCDFWGASDAPHFMYWTLAKWQAQKIGGAFFLGDRISLIDSYALGIHFGFNLTGNDGEMVGLRACGFSGDAFRACGNRLNGRGNWAADAYVIDANHPDGIQGFGRSGTLSDHLFEDTIIMEYSTPQDTRGAVGASLQVIGYHDGPYANLAFRRFVGASSSLNAYHVNACPSHTGEKIAMFTLPGPKGGATRIRVPSSAQISDVYVDKTASGSAPATGKPDYSKLAAFQVAALRGNRMPDIRAIMGW